VKYPALIGLAVCGCVTSGSQNIRPIAEEVIEASQRVLWTASLRALTNQGLPLRFSDPDEGIIETEYVDISQFQQAAAQYPSAERLVRFRFLLREDPEGEGTVLAVQGIYSPFRSGLSNTRRGERAVPRDHPAAGLIQRMVADARKIAEGG